MKFKTKNRITKTVLSLKGEGVEFFIRPLGLMYEGKKMSTNGEEGKACTLMTVIDLLTVDPFCQVVLPKVLRSELENSFPDGEYVGRDFRIKKGDKVDKGTDRSYYRYEIEEIKIEDKKHLQTVNDIYEQTLLAAREDEKEAVVDKVAE